ncbi:MAG: hypothetical protein AVDCRST_MAG52-849, partial [uncultured Blastococcus sp.]
GIVSVEGRRHRRGGDGGRGRARDRHRRDHGGLRRLPPPVRRRPPPRPRLRRRRGQRWPLHPRQPLPAGAADLGVGLLRRRGRPAARPALPEHREPRAAAGGGQDVAGQRLDPVRQLRRHQLHRLLVAVRLGAGAEQRALVLHARGPGGAGGQPAVPLRVVARRRDDEHLAGRLGRRPGPQPGDARGHDRVPALPRRRRGGLLHRPAVGADRGPRRRGQRPRGAGQLAGRLGDRRPGRGRLRQGPARARRRRGAQPVRPRRVGPQHLLPL